MIDVEGSRELRAVVLSLKAMDRELRGAINRETRQALTPIWREELGRRTRHPMDDRVLIKGAAVRGGNPAKAVAANSGRRLRGGLVPRESWFAFEFGANRNKVTTYRRRSKNGGSHQVRRHTARQLPARTPKGRVLFPAFAEAVPRLASLWTQTVIRHVYEAFEGK